jgi:hypothetical protein
MSDREQVDHLRAEVRRLELEIENKPKSENNLTFGWLAGILLTVVLGSGAWFTTSLNTKVDKLTETQSAMQTDVAVIKNQVSTILKEGR